MNWLAGADRATDGLTRNRSQPQWSSLQKATWTPVAEQGHGFKPTNMWAADHSWFTMTGYDLQGTQVCGAQDLIDRVRNCAALETVSVPDR